ncbi:MAG: EamA family transporter, partial [Spirochaetales bacterium]|nr:EamA family transporter [Spirochaetales bacterium]
MWIAFAFASALFAGLTSILAKLGIKETDSTVATALRTVVVLAVSWLMVLSLGSAQAITQVSAHTLLFLTLSGLATGGSWLCYFRALQLGPVNKVVPIDKSSTALTIILALVFLGEG